MSARGITETKDYVRSRNLATYSFSTLTPTFPAGQARQDLGAEGLSAIFEKAARTAGSRTREGSGAALL